MPAPLAGRRIVVTRSVEDNQLLAAQLNELGAEVIQLPLMEVTGPADGGRALLAAADRLEQYRFVVLTSVNGATALAEARAGRPWPAGVTAVPVGPATETAAVELGMTVGHRPSSATAENLVAEFPSLEGGDADMVLAPLAELAGDVVVDGLTARGYRVDRCEAYRTGAGPEVDIDDKLTLIKTGVDAVLFFAPSAVDRFVDLAGPALSSGEGQDGLAVCIGPSTAARADGRSFSGIVVADPHTEAGVISALIDAIP